MKVIAVSLEKRYKVTLEHKGKDILLFVSVINNLELKISFLTDLIFSYGVILKNSEKKAIIKILEKRFKTTIP